MEKKKYVYLFSEGNGSMKNLLGGKGANLSEMILLGIPVPQGFTVTTEACNKYYEDGKIIAEEVIEEIHEKIAELEKLTGKEFGSLTKPLLVSVRSGARVSMPGMMDTV
ncbi:PEP/pyruvate-binding domain-containing protein, partial [Bacillus anthracis]